jgi:hypothetical protein
MGDIRAPAQKPNVYAASRENKSFSLGSADIRFAPATKKKGRRGRPLIDAFVPQ